MSVRVIRKYANRRLYDTKESRHLTLDEVRDLIVGGERVRVEDATSGDDITRSILLQILVEREEAGDPMLSETVLTQLIRFYGGEFQGFLASYLEGSVSAFADRYDAMQDQFMSFVRENPIADATRRNLAMWEDLQKQLANTWFGAPQKKSDDDDKH